MRVFLRNLTLFYILIGIPLGVIMWLSFLWPVLWRAPVEMTFSQQVMGILALQPVAILSGIVRFALWGPSLLSWLAGFQPGYTTFGVWLGPGFYGEVVPTPN